MKMLKKLEEMIHEELEGAEEYAKCALKHKEEDRDMADMFYDMSQQEMKHAMMLHDRVKSMMEKCKEEHGELPVDVSVLYDYLHEHEIEEIKEVKMLQQMYK